MTTHQSREKWFRVEVTDESGQIVAIESEMLAGRGEIGEQEEETIRRAIAHLTGFVGGSFASQPAGGAVGEWQPIETAPKDGTWILGWSRDNQPFRISWGRNHEAELRWCTSFASFVDGYITHWMPLQEPSHD